MTEKYPTWLTGHVKEWAEKRLPTVTLCSTTGNELLEVWYYGDLLTVKGEPQSYIVDSDEAPGLVAARDPESGEAFIIFDGGRAWPPTADRISVLENMTAFSAV